MLDWSKIDNWPRFQRLVNHLFALECNSPGFIPSNPYIGADGGWDGYYEGEYEGIEGIWSIQSKWTSKSGKEAVIDLKPRIREEFADAQKNKVNHLRIATNADLNVDQVKELRDLGEWQNFSLKVWAREDLERRIELQPFLRYYFFGQSQYPKFVPWNIYFSDKEKHLLEISDSQISKFGHYINDAKKFIMSDSSSILLIHSPGGYGKTHLLREIAKIAHKTDLDRQPWLVKPYQRKMEDAIRDEIIFGRKYLLIFDDADRALDEIKPLLSFCNDGDVKVILALRTSGLNYIRNIISDLRCEGNYEEMSISNWSKDDLISLLRISAGQKKVDHEEVIAIRYNNPFLIVWIGKQVKGKPDIDFKTLKEKLINSVKHDAKGCLGGILDSLQIEKLLLNLSCIVPLSNQDMDFMKKLAERVDIKIEKLNECLDLLQQAGVLRLIGYYIRFDPDMIGDLFLAWELEKNGNKLNNLMTSWFDIAKEQLIINIESAARRANIPYFREMLSEMVNKWTSEAVDTPVNVRKERLRIIQHIALRIPEESFDLLSAYLETKDPPASDPIIMAFGARILTTDDYGPIFEELLRVSQLRSKILEFIIKLEKSGREGTYYNYKPESLVKYSVSPLHNNIQQILDTLDIMAKWIENPEKLTTELIVSALSEVLAGSHEYKEFGPVTITIGEKILEDDKRIRKIRNKALSILESMIMHQSPHVKIAGIQIAEKIGTTWSRMIPRDDVPLSDRMAEERAKVVEYIGSIIAPEMDFDILSKIEDLFLSWWIWQVSGTDNVKGYLRDFPRSLEYIVFRYFVSPERAIENFYAIEADAPEYDRFSWFNEKFTKPIRSDYTGFKPLAGNLNQRYKTKESLIELLKSLDRKISTHSTWYHPPIISCWVSLNQDLFKSIRNQNDLWETTPERFKNEIDSALAEFDETHIYKMANEIFTNIANVSIAKVDNFLRWISKHHIDKSDLDLYLSKLIENGNVEIRNLIVFYLNHIFKHIDDISFIIKHLKLAVSKEDTFTNGMIHNLSSILYSLNERLDTIRDKSLNELKKQILDKLRDIAIINYADMIIDLACNDVDSVIDFIDYRLQKYLKNISNDKDGPSIKGYKAIPYNGIDCIKDKIKNFADYKKFMEKMINWYEEYKSLREFDLKYLMKPLAQSYLKEYIEDQVQCNNIKKAIIASCFLELSEENISTIVRVSEKGIELGLDTEVRRMLNPFPTGVYSSNIGEPAPALVDRKNLFEKMVQIAKNPIVRSLLKNRIKIIENDIEQDLKRDEILRNL